MTTNKANKDGLEPIEPYYLRQGTEIIDTFFDLGYFHLDISRNDMRKLDELVGYYIQSAAETARKVERLTRKISDHEALDRKKKQ